MTVREWLMQEPIPVGSIIEVSVRKEPGEYEDYETVLFFDNGDMREFEDCTVYVVNHRTGVIYDGKLTDIIEIVVSPEEIHVPPLGDGIYDV